MSTISAGLTSGSALVSSGDTTGQLVFQTNGTTTAMTISTAQVVTFANTPVISGGASVVTTTGTQTLTNKTINGSNNTITNVSLTTGVTGTLPVANGGTNSTATPTSGAIAYGTGTAYAFTSAGTSGQVLTSAGSGAPTWTTPSAGAMTLIASGTLTSPASQILVNNLVTTGYSAVIIELLEIKFVAASNIYLQFVAPGGTTSSGLFYAGVAFTRSSPNGMNTNNFNGINDCQLPYMNNSSGVISANVNVFSPNLSTTYRQFYVNSGGYNGSAGINYWAGGYHNASSFGGFRIYGDSVNIDTGASYRVYGVV